MLRRLKTDVDFVIPPKREVVVYAQLSAVQQEMYRCILNKTIEQLVKSPSETPVCCMSHCFACTCYIGSMICSIVFHSLQFVSSCILFLVLTVFLLAYVYIYFYVLYLL